ncbi:MAG: glycosyltransferase family 2 protein [Flavisolibacter sp.]
MPLLSIITAIHNGLAFNQLFYESLVKYTVHPFELIIIDNASTDGSREYFESVGARLVRNPVNYSYPYCQNQGIDLAKGDYLCFLNNDLILSPRWDEILVEASRLHGVDVLSASGIENLGNREETKAIDRKWKRTKNPLMVLGFGKRNLALMHRVMYGNWEKFCAKKFEAHQYEVVEGIVGNNVLMTRRGLEILGPWDERIQSADFDLFMRTKKRALTEGDIKPCQIALGAFIHHYSRMTSKYAVKPKPFADQAGMIGLEQKWTAQEANDWHPDNSTIRKSE